MDVLVIVISALIVLSKFFDCWTTSTQITNPKQESNPIARYLFVKFGSQTIIWLIFVLTILIVWISLWLLYTYYNTIIYKFLFLVVGIIVSTAQFAVAHTNKTRKLNFFTKLLLARYHRNK